MTRAAAIAVAIAAAAACGRSAGAPARHAAPAPATRAAPVAELLTAITDDWDATHATLRLWRRDGGRWVAVGEPWPAVIGQTGAAWGIGVSGSGAPAGRGGPVKREGDRKSPAGMFELARSFGYAAAPPAGTHLPYTQTDASWLCVDDTASAHYGEILRAGSDADWHSAEHMRRDDALYTWVIDVAHNPAHVRGAGSCIFLHEWAGPDSTTVGCTAMAEPALAHLLATLAPHARYVLLPRAEYRALAGTWGLPAQ